MDDMYRHPWRLSWRLISSYYRLRLAELECDFLRAVLFVKRALLGEW